MRSVIRRSASSATTSGRETRTMRERISFFPTSDRAAWRFVGGRRESVRTGFHVGIRATLMMRRRASRCTHSMEETNYLRVCTERRNVRALEPGEHPPLGTHLIVPWLGFTHHGVYVGEGRVVHYGALMYDIIRKPVEE